MGDWIQVWIAVILTVTLVLVFSYVSATWRMAKAALQPVLIQWLDVDEQVVKYWNVGTGPALHIRWQLGDQDDQRLAMGIRDEKGSLDKLDLTRVTSPITLVADYQDVDGASWRSTLSLNPRADGKWENGTPAYESSEARNRFSRALAELLR